MATAQTAGPGPGYQAHPDHKVVLGRDGRRARVVFNGVEIADSANPIVVREADYDAVLYFPRTDVRMEHLTPTDHDTYCPFKGTASYWTIAVDGKTSENAVWSYEDPYDETADLKDHMAFYADRMDDVILSAE